MRRRDLPALRFLERDETGLSRQHFDRDAENARQQFLKVEFFGQQADDLKQIVALVNAKIRKHGVILSPAIFCWRMSSVNKISAKAFPLI